MEPFTIIAGIVTLTAILAVANHWWLRLPESIGVMVMALLLSLVILIVGTVYPRSVAGICQVVETFDFSYFVLGIALAFLVFAGAFSSDTRAMSRERRPILVLATVGILLSTVIIGGLTYGLLNLIGVEISFTHSLLFGALISPTDPIAVLAILKQAGAPRDLAADIAGESLLNDGVAVVVFLSIYHFAEAGVGMGMGIDPDMDVGHFGAGEVVRLFVQEAIGGAVLGLALGWIGLKALRLAMQPSLDVFVTLAVVMGGYAFADAIHVSGPLALVVAGLVMASRLRGKNDLSVAEREHVNVFWESIDEILNAVLFVLMGLVILSLVEDFTPAYGAAILIALAVVLFGRVVSVTVSVMVTKLRCGKSPAKTVAALSWGGLRGGISVALALSLKPDMSRELIVFMTYGVVVFSILVQGLTIGLLIRRLGLNAGG